MSLRIGQPAPLFSLYNSEKQLVKLDELKGQNILLLFIPAAFTSTCLKEFCSVRDDISSYNNFNCKVIGLSADTVYVLARWKDEQKFNFDLVSDFNKEVSGLYDAQYEIFNYGMKGIPKRAAFLIDKEGILRYVEVLDNSGLIPDFEKIKETLDTLK